MEHQAEQAQFILTHPLVVSALDEMDGALNDALSRVSERDSDGIKNLVLMKKCVRKFREVFEAHINTGKLDKAKLLDEPESRIYQFRKRLFGRE